MPGFRNTKGFKSFFEFENTKAIRLAPIIQTNGNSREVGHEKKESAVDAR